MIQRSIEIGPWVFHCGHTKNFVMVIATIPMAKVRSEGEADCSPEDTFDIRIGVPLALKRALGKIPGADRKKLMREFFRAWPEAHPEYRQPKAKPDYRIVGPRQTAQSRVAQQAAAMVACKDRTREEIGKDLVAWSNAFTPPPDSRPLTDCPKCSLKVAVGETCAFCETVEPPQFRCL